MNDEHVKPRGPPRPAGRGAGETRAHKIFFFFFWIFLKRHVLFDLCVSVCRVRVALSTSRFFYCKHKNMNIRCAHHLNYTRHTSTPNNIRYTVSNMLDSHYKALHGCIPCGTAVVFPCPTPVACCHRTLAPTALTTHPMTRAHPTTPPHTEPSTVCTSWISGGWEASGRSRQSRQRESVS